jgi:tRNA-Thr(GGU) m(6)t(6)A37 methyltransferase TsaA
MMEIRYKPVGVIRTPFKTLHDMPIQAAGAKGVTGRVEIEQVYQPGLKDLEGFSHIFLIYHFHKARGYALEVRPFLDDDKHGIFATRAPKRPNPIGISVVKLTGIQGCTLSIEDIDVLDETPLLDIKPFVPEFDTRQTQQTGWLSGKADKVHNIRADKRFTGE